MKNKLIKLEAVSRVYQTREIETTAVNSIDLSIYEGEFVSIMGPSGCGKSTLLNLIGLLDTPTSGSYWFQEDNVTQIEAREKAIIRKNNIGFVFQNFNLIEELTVYENIELPLIYHKVDKRQIKERVKAVMDQVGISQRANHYPPQLSGGQQQRVAVARALVIDPRVILADEPTGNLDSSNGDDILQLIQKLNHNNTTIIMVTHSESDAQKGKRIIRMMDGELISDERIR